MKILYVILALGLLGLLGKGVFSIFNAMESRRRRFLNGILLNFLGVILLLSMFSYIITRNVENNLFGPLGFYLSSFLFGAFGISSLLLPVLVFLGGFGLLRDKLDRLLFKTGGFITGVFFILFITLGYFPVSDWIKGELGKKTGGLLVHYIGIWGAIILSLFLLAFLILLFFEGTLFKGRIKDFSGREDIPVNTPHKVDRKKSERRERRKEKRNKKRKEKKRKPEKEEKKHSIDTDSDEDFQKKFLSLLKEPVKGEGEDAQYLKTKAMLLEEKLRDLGVEGRVINTIVGPVITRFEYKPASGVKISRIANLTDDLAMALRAEKLRILAPIPGREVVGIEIPNRKRETVYLKELLMGEVFQKTDSMLFIPIGKDITGKPYYSDIGEMPHLLVAGSTGSGKSVFLNSLITSILFKATQEDVRFIMVDPKRIELSIYNGIPHLIGPAITEPEDAVRILRKAERCMETRYVELSRVGVRDIYAYNRKMKEKMPFVIVIVDELADILLQKGREVEKLLIRLAQKARAVGIHLVLATQRPSVDVITGLIKANFPSRIAFQVASRHDAKTIMDTTGAEKLLGKGDMLFTPPKGGSPIRLHGPFISTEETKGIVKLIGGRYLEVLLKDRFDKSREIVALALEEDVLDVISDLHLPGAWERLEVFAGFLNKELGINSQEFLEFVEEIRYYPPLKEFEEEYGVESGGVGDGDEKDPLFWEAAEIVVEHGVGSASLLQRKLKIGYNRAARIIDQLEREGIVGPFKGSKSRDVLVKNLDELKKKWRS